MTIKRQIITGPDIDRLAEGIYGPELETLRQQVLSLRANLRNIEKENKTLRKRLEAASNVEKVLRQGIADHKTARTKLVRENADLKTRLSVKVED